MADQAQNPPQSPAGPLPAAGNVTGMYMGSPQDTMPLEFDDLADRTKVPVKAANSGATPLDQGDHQPNSRLDDLRNRRTTISGAIVRLNGSNAPNKDERIRRLSDLLDRINGGLNENPPAPQTSDVSKLLERLNVHPLAQNGNAKPSPIDALTDFIRANNTPEALVSNEAELKRLVTQGATALETPLQKAATSRLLTAVAKAAEYQKIHNNLPMPYTTPLQSELRAFNIAFGLPVGAPAQPTNPNNPTVGGAAAPAQTPATPPKSLRDYGIPTNDVELRTLVRNIVDNRLPLDAIPVEGHPVMQIDERLVRAAENLDRAYQKHEKATAPKGWFGNLMTGFMRAMSGPESVDAAAINAHGKITAAVTKLEAAEEAFNKLLLAKIETHVAKTNTAFSAADTARILADHTARITHADTPPTAGQQEPQRGRVSTSDLIARNNARPAETAPAPAVNQDLIPTRPANLGPNTTDVAAGQPSATPLGPLEVDLINAKKALDAARKNGASLADIKEADTKFNAARAAMKEHWVSTRGDSTSGSSSVANSGRSTLPTPHTAAAVAPPAVMDAETATLARLLDASSVGDSNAEAKLRNVAKAIENSGKPQPAPVVSADQKWSIRLHKVYAALNNPDTPQDQIKGLKAERDTLVQRLEMYEQREVKGIPRDKAPTTAQVKAAAAANAAQAPTAAPAADGKPPLQLTYSKPVAVVDAPPRVDLSMGLYEQVQRAIFGHPAKNQEIIPDSTKNKLFDMAARRITDPEKYSAEQAEALARSERRMRPAAIAKDQSTITNKALLTALQNNDVDGIALAVRQVRDLEISTTRQLYGYGVPNLSQDSAITTTERLNAAHMAEDFHTKAYADAIHNHSSTSFNKLYQKLIVADANLDAAEKAHKTQAARLIANVVEAQATTTSPAQPKAPAETAAPAGAAAPEPVAPSPSAKPTPSTIRSRVVASVGKAIDAPAFGTALSGGMLGLGAGIAAVQVINEDYRGASETSGGLIAGLATGAAAANAFLANARQTLNSGVVSVLQGMPHGKKIAAVLAIGAYGGYQGSKASGEMQSFLTRETPPLPPVPDYASTLTQASIPQAIVAAKPVPYHEVAVPGVDGLERFPSPRDTKKATETVISATPRPPAAPAPAPITTASKTPAAAQPNPIDEILRMDKAAIQAVVEAVKPAPATPAPKAAAKIVHTVVAGEALSQIAQDDKFETLRRAVKAALGPKATGRDVLTMSAIVIADANNDTIRDMDKVRAGIQLRDVDLARVGKIVDILKAPDCGKVTSDGHIAPGVTPRVITELLACKK